MTTAGRDTAYIVEITSGKPGNRVCCPPLPRDGARVTTSVVDEGEEFRSGRDRSSWQDGLRGM